MWHRIAHRQARTLAEAQATNDARDYAELCALWEIDPWGPERAGLDAANIVKAIADTLGGAKGRRPVADYALRYRPREPMTPAAMRAALRVAATLGGFEVKHA